MPKINTTSHRNVQRARKRAWKSALEQDTNIIMTKPIAFNNKKQGKRCPQEEGVSGEFRGKA